jgi:hypothetical protein
MNTTTVCTAPTAHASAIQSALEAKGYRVTYGTSRSYEGENMDVDGYGHFEVALNRHGVVVVSYGSRGRERFFKTDEAKKAAASIIRTVKDAKVKDAENKASWARYNRDQRLEDGIKTGLTCRNVKVDVYDGRADFTATAEVSVADAPAFLAEVQAVIARYGATRPLKTESEAA